LQLPNVYLALCLIAYPSANREEQSWQKITERPPACRETRGLQGLKSVVFTRYIFFGESLV
jgi:hypothetical protein